MIRKDKHEEGSSILMHAMHKPLLAFHSGCLNSESQLLVRMTHLRLVEDESFAQVVSRATRETQEIQQAVASSA